MAGRAFSSHGDAARGGTTRSISAGGGGTKAGLFEVVLLEWLQPAIMLMLKTMANRVPMVHL